MSSDNSRSQVVYPGDIVSADHAVASRTTRTNVPKPPRVRKYINDVGYVTYVPFGTVALVISSYCDPSDDHYEWAYAYIASQGLFAWLHFTQDGWVKIS